jgi:uncharacterized protein YuzE
MTLSYDKETDVLYITFQKSPGQRYRYVENENGDVLRLDSESNQVVGVTMPYFLKRVKKNKLSIPEVSDVPLNEIAKHLVAI